MQRFVTARGDATTAGLEIVHPRRNLTVRAVAIDELCHATFAGVVPVASAEGGNVTVEYPRFALAGMLRQRTQRAEIDLSTAVPWTFACRGGVGDSAVDLRALDLASFEIAGGVSNLQLLLPVPRRAVRIRITGGASRFTLMRPADVAATLHVRGAVNRLQFDGERYGAIGGPTELKSNGSDGVHYEIEILGGASALTIGEVTS